MTGTGGGESLTLRASRALFVIGFVVIVAATAMAVDLARHGDRLGLWSAPFLVLSALTVLVPAIAPGRLVLDQHGMTVHGVAGRQPVSVAWPEISEFRIVLLQGVSRVGYRCDRADEPPPGALLRAWRRAPLSSRLLPNTYGMTAGDLLELLEDWRRAAVDPGPGGPSGG